MIPSKISSSVGISTKIPIKREYIPRHIFKYSKAIIRYMDPTSDIQVRKVGVLSGRARETAEEAGYAEDDLVIVRVHIKEHSLPDYTLEKITGNPLEYLQEHLR